MESDASALVCRKAQSFYSPLLLHHECKFQHCEKANHTFSMIMKIFLIFMDPEKALQSSYRSTDFTLKTSGILSA